MYNGGVSYRHIHLLLFQLCSYLKLCGPCRYLPRYDEADTVPTLHRQPRHQLRHSVSSRVDVDTFNNRFRRNNQYIQNGFAVLSNISNHVLSSGVVAICATAIVIALLLRKKRNNKQNVVTTISDQANGSPNPPTNVTVEADGKAIGVGRHELPARVEHE